MDRTSRGSLAQGERRAGCDARLDEYYWTSPPKARQRDLPCRARRLRLQSARRRLGVISAASWGLLPLLHPAFCHDLERNRA